MSDFLGERGECIFRLELNDSRQPLFRARFLGDKWPTLDFFVQLENGDRQGAFFLAQVRGSTRSVRGMLDIQVSRDHVLRLQRYKVPTYVIGVDLRDERAFVLALGSCRTGFRGLPKKFPLDEHRHGLYDEVIRYWDEVQSWKGSSFVHPLHPVRR